MGVVYGNANLNDFTSSEQQQIQDGVQNAMNDALGQDSGAIGSVSLHSGSIIVVVCYRADSNVSMSNLTSIADLINSGSSSLSINVSGTTLTPTGAAALAVCTADASTATVSPTSAPTAAPSTTTASPDVDGASSNSDSFTDNTGGVVGVSLVVVAVVVGVIALVLLRRSKDKSSGDEAYTYDDYDQATKSENVYDAASPEAVANPNSTPERDSKPWDSPRHGSWDYDTVDDSVGTRRTLEYDIGEGPVKGGQSEI